MSIQEELKKIGLKPERGQNFLQNSSTIEALVAAGEVEDKTVLEIGPGTGSITEKIMESAEKVYAVENDSRLANYLKEKFKDNIEIIKDDFLEYKIPDEVERCVSNLPFQITSEALEKLGKEQLQSALILQRDVADKITAEPGDKKYCFQTVVCQYYFIPVKLRDISSRNFYPQPEVETSIVKLYPNRDRHGVKNEDEFLELVQTLFNNDRKKVRNSFVDGRHILGFEKHEAKNIRDKLPHSDKRVKQLEISQLRQINSKIQDFKD